MHTALHIEATGWTEGQVRDVHSIGFHGCGTPHSFDVSISVNVTGPSAVRMLSGVGWGGVGGARWGEVVIKLWFMRATWET